MISITSTNGPPQVELLPSRKLYLRDLIILGACKEQRDLFSQKFGDSVDVTVPLAERVATEFDFSCIALQLILSGKGQRAFSEKCFAAWVKGDQTSGYVACAANIHEYKRARAIAWAQIYISEGQ